MAKKKTLRILFVGNSHTYFNDMPIMVQRRAEDEGYDCTVTMLAHAGWFLAQHAEEPDVRFNILYGNYDYVVLQEHAHPFGPEEKFREAAVALNKNDPRGWEHTSDLRMLGPESGAGEAGGNERCPQANCRRNRCACCPSRGGLVEL